jgi:hypothetical protein
VAYRGLPADAGRQAPTQTYVFGVGWKLALLVLIIILTWFLAHDHTDHVSRVYRFQLPLAPSFLSEQLAVAKAREALTQSGFDTTTWIARPLGARDHSAAPNGKRDVYLTRTITGEPNSGIIIFQSAENSKTEQTVIVQLKGNEVLCTITRAR